MAKTLFDPEKNYVLWFPTESQQVNPRLPVFPDPENANKNSCFSAILALSLEVDATLKKLLEHNAYKTQTHKSTNIHRIFTHLGMFINHAI